MRQGGAGARVAPLCCNGRCWAGRDKAPPHRCCDPTASHTPPVTTGPRPQNSTWKTALQMVAMSLLLVLRNGEHLLGNAPGGEALGWGGVLAGDECPRRLADVLTPPTAPAPAVMAWLRACTWASFLLLWVATGLALWSLANYMANVWHFFRYPGTPKPA